MARTKIVKPLPGQGIPEVVDTNPARTASDVAEGNAEVLEKKEITQDNLEQGQAYLDRVQTNADEQIQLNQDEQDAANLAAETNVSDMDLINSLMDQLGVDTLHENSSQEYFTNLNLAINSEGGVKDRVKTHTKEA